jgi:L-asparaginase II
MAIAYANYARPDKFSFQRQTACQKLSKVMVKYPHLVAGSGRFTTFLLEQLGSKLIAKDGSEGIFCIGLPREGLGIAIKIEDGSARALAPVVLRVLDELGVLNKQEKEALEPYYYPQIRNFRNEVIGRIRAAF